MSAQWFVVHVSAGSENRIAQEMRDQFVRARIEEQLEEVLVPKKEVSVIRRGVRTKTEERILPGYVFVKMEHTPESAHVIRRLPRVIGILGSDSETPRPLSEEELGRLMNQVSEISSSTGSGMVFEPGEVVKVTSGLFASMQGVVEEVQEERARLKISISILGRSTPVDLEFTQVEKVV